MYQYFQDLQAAFTHCYKFGGRLPIAHNKSHFQQLFDIVHSSGKSIKNIYNLFIKL